MKKPAFLFSPESMPDMVAAKMPLTNRPSMPTGMTTWEMAMNEASSGALRVGKTAGRSICSARAAMGGRNQMMMPMTKSPAPR